MERVVVKLETGESERCSRITNASGIWVGLLQIHGMFLAATPLQTFKHHLSRHGVTQRLAETKERQFMAFTGAIKPKGPSCSLLEVTSLSQLLPNFTVDAKLAPQIAAIAQLPADDGAPASSQPSNPQQLGQGPLTLPINRVSQTDLKLPYSLHQAEQMQQPVQGQMEAFMAWLSQPIQLDRKGAPLADRTQLNVTKHVWQYLGFLQLHLSRDQLSLWDFLDLEAYAAYISFHRARGNEYSTIVVHFTSAKQVLQYLASIRASAIPRVQNAKEWISRVQRQLGQLMTKPAADPADLPPAHHIVRLVDSFRQATLRSLPLDSQPWSLEQARAVHDACLACCMFGYIPPVRLLCLRTLQMVGTTGCHWPGCKRPRCEGNRLAVINNQLHFILSHYKVEKR